MKHGLIVLAHGNIPDLVDVLAQFGPDCVAYVHLDRKVHVSGEDIRLLKEQPNVRFVSRRYAVNWGGLNIVKAILLLVREAVKDTEIGYLHMITGTDRIIVMPSMFKAFFARNAGTEYLLHFPLPTPYWPNGGLDRLARFDPIDLFDVRSARGKRSRNFMLHVQQRLGLERSIPADFPPLYGGSMSWSLTRELLLHVLTEVDRKPAFLRRFAFTYCPDEIALQTLIMNSPFAARVENNNLRYIDWTRKKNPQPYVLDLDNWDAMIGSGMLFARKIDRPFS
ncbi:MAG: beta-1,6-N-acetylglucosaminyltransferase, partial [Flavobacteriales bacterium]